VELTMDFVVVHEKNSKVLNSNKKICFM